MYRDNHDRKLKAINKPSYSDPPNFCAANELQWKLKTKVCSWWWQNKNLFCSILLLNLSFNGYHKSNQSLTKFQVFSHDSNNSNGVTEMLSIKTWCQWNSKVEFVPQRQQVVYFLYEASHFYYNTNEKVAFW